MTIPQLHMYDLKTGEYTGSRDATRRPNGEYMLEATGATPVALPADIPAGHIARWTGDAWEAVEDHRQHMDEPQGRRDAVLASRRHVAFRAPVYGGAWPAPYGGAFGEAGKVGRGAGARSAGEDQGAACGA